MTFETGQYFARDSRPSFYPRVEVGACLMPWESCVEQSQKLTQHRRRRSSLHCQTLPTLIITYRSFFLRFHTPPTEAHERNVQSLKLNTQPSMVCNGVQKGCSVLRSSSSVMIGEVCYRYRAPRRCSETLVAVVLVRRLLHLSLPCRWLILFLPHRSSHLPGPCIIFAFSSWNLAPTRSLCFNHFCVQFSTHVS